LILADTSIWIDHLRGRMPEMQKQLDLGKLFMHPFVVAELALGSLRDRANTLAVLDGLLRVEVARLSEVRSMVEAHSLYAKGIGLRIDVMGAHLIASCLITPGTQLWTHDAALGNIAGALGVRAALP
jgi:predicted nucleic acid-binding protein